MSNVRMGLEVLAEDHRDRLADARLGLLMNQASVDHRCRSACDVVAEAFPGQLQLLFSPQHGFWSEQQANMIESADTRYGKLNLPVCSLYSATRRPPPDRLQDIDVLLIDLQDTGTRVYTFIWTMLECLRAAVETGTEVIVLDRPNPLGGCVVEGPLIESGFESFVGGAAIPMRHGLTMGTLARLLNTELSLGVRLDVISAEQSDSGQLWPATKRLWVPPSPNMPRWETAVVYPGQVLLEGTNLSEGRGTTRPFECCGAPWIDPHELVEALGAEAFPGLILQPIRFRPTFDKWCGEICGGVALHITDAAAVRSFAFSVQLLLTVRQLYPHQFRLLDPPYEYETIRPPIDILYGSSRLREALNDAGRTEPCLWANRLCGLDGEAWWARTAACL
jgi:uncharacterized protein YbbC (DUF1343 family)